jgi:outer membrane receptor for monomeric catechols
MQLAPTTVIASRPVAQSNYYGSLRYDYDEVSQESYTGRVEHDVNRSITLRNQARYNHTHRTAVISTVQSPASFAPDTELVTVARQGNERENRILSNQSSMVSRFAGAIESCGQRRPGVHGRGTICATLTDWARQLVSIYSPNPNDPVTGYAVAATAPTTRAWTNTVGSTSSTRLKR